MTENEYLKAMITAAGGDPDKLPNNLKSSYYKCLIDCMNKGGGGGGVTFVYGYTPESADGFLAYKDAELTQPLTYAEGKELFLNGAVLRYSSEIDGMTHETLERPFTVMAADEFMLIALKLSNASNMIQEVPAFFSDTPGVGG